MRYVLVSVVKGEAGAFNDGVRREVFQRFKAGSSKLPAHFTIKAPFEYEGDITPLEKTLERFSKREKAQKYDIMGWDHFDERVIFMKVLMSKEGKEVHDRLIDELNAFGFLNFTRKDGKDKTFHVTVCSKKVEPVFRQAWEYVRKLECKFGCNFDNLCLYGWEDNTWKLLRLYEMADR